MGILNDVSQYDVLIKTNGSNEITVINSSIFVKDTENYIVIDSGSGEKYSHAQNNYLDKPLTDDYGRYNYQYIDGKIVEVLHGEYIKEEIVTIQDMLLEQTIENTYDIALLKLGVI